jgi:tetratricopeptide (TPR) repeat protein
MDVYANYLQAELRFSEAIQMRRAIFDLDPLSGRAATALQLALLIARRFDEALEVGARASELQSTYTIFLEAMIEYSSGSWALGADKSSKTGLDDPNDPEGPFLAGLIFLNLQMPDAAEEQLRIAVQIDPDHPVSQSVPLLMDLYRGDLSQQSYRTAKRMIEDHVPSRQNSLAFAARVFVDYGVSNNALDEVLEIFAGRYPGLFDDDPRISDEDLRVAFFAGRAMIHNGQSDKGKTLLKEYLRNNEKFDRAYGISLRSAAASALIGDKTGALEKLKSVDLSFGGLRQPWVIALRNNSDFDSIRNEPGFVAKLEEYENKAAEQRAILEEMNRE